MTHPHSVVTLSKQGGLVGTPTSVLQEEVETLRTWVLPRLGSSGNSKGVTVSYSATYRGAAGPAGRPISVVLKLELQNPLEGLLKTDFCAHPPGSQLAVSVIGSWSSPGASNCEQQRHLVVRRGTSLGHPVNLGPLSAQGSRMMPRQHALDRI